jgi:hypothetical protein
MSTKPCTIRIRKRGRTFDTRPNEDVTFATTLNDINVVRVMQHPEIDRNLLQYHPHLVNIGYGCLLIPAIFLVWWYWTKRTARRVAHGVITFTHRGRSSTRSTPSPLDPTTTIYSGDDDGDRDPQKYTTYASSSESHQPNESCGYYRSWDDTLPKEKKFRFIPWMKRTKTSRTRQTVYTSDGIANSKMDQQYADIVETVSCNDYTYDGYRSMGSPSNFVANIQTPSNPTTGNHTGIEMFVIEYPQQMSHPSNTISII